jgi:hypothetical protein
MMEAAMSDSLVVLVIASATGDCWTADMFMPSLGDGNACSSMACSL